MKARERASLTIRVGREPEIGAAEQIAENYLPVETRVFVVNEGSTKAFNVEAFTILTFTSYWIGAPWEQGGRKEIPRMIGDTDTNPVSVVASGIEPEAKMAGATGSSTDFIDPVTIKKIKLGTVFLQVNGLITSRI